MIEHLNRENAAPLQVKHRFAASRERVFAAWTKQEILRKWWGPPGSTTSLVEIDLRVGGEYRLGIKLPNEGIYFISGTYQVVQPPEKLAFTWHCDLPEMDVGQTLVTLEFYDQGGSTEVLLTHARLPDKGAYDVHKGGWVGILENLAQFLDRKG